MPHQPLEDENFSRSGGAVAALFSAAPFAALGGAAALGPVALIAGVIAAPWARLARTTGAGGVPLALAAAFIAWTAASLLWSPQRDFWLLAPLAGGVLFALLVAGAGFARPADIGLVRRAGIGGVVALLALLLFETALEFPIAGALGALGEAGGGTGAALEITQRGLSLAGLWIWGAAALLAGYRWPGWVTTGAMAAAALWIGANLPFTFLNVALLVGLAVAALAFVWPRAAVAGTAWTIAILILAAPLILPHAAALSAQLWRDQLHQDPGFPWLARVDTWSYATGLIREKLITGWGLGAAATFTETHTLAGFTTPYIPGHPQNWSMHLWLETGAIGAFLAAGTLAAFGVRAGAALAHDRWIAAATSGTMATAFVISTAGVPAWALWWWAGLAIAAALVRSARRAP